MPTSSMRRWIALLGVGLIAVMGGAGIWIGSNYSTVFHRKHPQSRPSRAADEAEVHRFCGECHAYPPPDSFPRGAWAKEVDQGFRFAQIAGMNRNLPDIESIKQYYEQRAPIELPFHAPPPLATRPPFQFERTRIALPTLEQRPVVTSIAFAGASPSADEFVICDARTNQVMLFQLGGAAKWKKLAGMNHPARAIVADLDKDGIRDILVANLGVFFPSDDLRGSVVLLRGRSDGTFEPHTLLENVGRVADVKPIDFNRDGKLDLIVAVFGWRATGEVLLLENKTTDPSNPIFEPRVIDRRHGATEIAVADLNRDNHPDFVCLFSQEHEAVVAFINDGEGGFRQENIYQAPHPAYGCCSLELADLDGDGDLDVLLANGDILDPPFLLKPYHGLQWLENRGPYPFVPHPIGPLYGVLSARSADFDGDGDLDIAAVTYLPANGFPQRNERGLPAVVLYEQVGRGTFATHVLETGRCDNLCCLPVLLQSDQLPSLLIGHGDFLNETKKFDAVSVWRNRGRK